jgi:hypothetical protein
MSVSVFRWVRFAAALTAATAALTGTCLGWCGCRNPYGYFVDGQTKYMWARTWHAPNSLESPLTQYYIPRTPGACNSDRPAHEVGCQSTVQATIPGQYGARPYFASAGAGFEPVQSERLGKVPNELGLGGSLPMPMSPARPPAQP